MNITIKPKTIGRAPEEQKVDRAREIIRTSAFGADWLPVPEPFYSGDEIGFDLNGISFRGNVIFDRYAVTLNLTSPVVNKAFSEVYYRQQTFFRRNPPGASLFAGGVEGGPATQRCIETARELLIGLYTDWFILQSRGESIRRRLTAFPEYMNEFLPKEQERISPLKMKILELSRLSGENKRRFKKGEISQQEYVSNRRPLHNEIVSLMGEARVRDPFRTLFSSELDDCMYAMDKKKFIESI